MFRIIIPALALTTLTACMGAAPPAPPASTGGQPTLEQSLTGQRMTLPSPDPDGGPLVFEFYAGGQGLLAFDEVAERGQTPLIWDAAGNQLCVSEPDGTRRECSTVTVRGSALTLQNGTSAPMLGTLTPL